MAKTLTLMTSAEMSHWVRVNAAELTNGVPDECSAFLEELVDAPEDFGVVGHETSVVVEESCDYADFVDVGGSFHGSDCCHFCLLRCESVL